MMQKQLRQRLQELKSEFELGQKALLEADTRAKELRDTLLRISGAIQVLEEELAKESASADEPAALRAVTPKPLKSGSRP
jgi:hypothetical protein